MARKKLYACTSSGRIELGLTLEQAQSVAHQSQCDADLKELSKLPSVRKQIAKWKPATLAGELREYGAWEPADLQNHDENVQRMLWLLAGDIVENRDA